MKIYIRSTQAIFAGTRYDKQAAKILTGSGLFDEKQASDIIEGLFHQDIHAFVHAPAWLEKYLKGIARMCIEESHGTQNGVAYFLGRSVNTFDRFLTYVKTNRDSLGGAAFDNKFNNEMSYQDVVDFMDQIQAEKERQSAEELANMEPSTSSNYELVPIESYKQFHSMFGGAWTGDGYSSSYAGGGGTAWCHANNESTYRSWVDRNFGKFYVLMNKDFKDIPFNQETNEQNPKDAYGNSLIAILVNLDTGKLLNATLRCNHVGVSTNADNQYDTYAELSRIAGFNVQQAVYEDLGIAEGGIKNLVPTSTPKFEVGSKIQVKLTIRDVTATAIQRYGNSTLFMFDSVLGRTTPGYLGSNLENYLVSVKDCMPPDLTNRLRTVRLLQPSEVFSNCDDPTLWEDLSGIGCKLDKPQIPCFVSRRGRHKSNDIWWLQPCYSQNKGKMQYIGVFDDGDFYYHYRDDEEGNIIPVFELEDLD